MQIEFVLVGNGIMNSETDNIGQFTYPWTHALIATQIAGHAII